MSHMFLLPAPCLLKHSAWFPLRSQLSAGSANSEHDPACYTRAWMPLGAWQELLSWHRKALAGLSLELCHKPQVNPDPSCPPASCWTVPCSEQLQASSTQQMNHHQSKCYLTRFILAVFYYIPIILSIARKILSIPGFHIEAPFSTSSPAVARAVHSSTLL